MIQQVMKISTLYDVEPILESSRGLSENTKRCAVNAALPQQPVTPFGTGIATSKLMSERPLHMEGRHGQGKEARIGKET